MKIEVRAAHVLAERIGGAIWETDVERGEMTRIADSELRKLATYAGDRPIKVDDVEALTADTRPASVFAITNALDRREPAAAAEALRRALAEGQPGLRILASLAGRVSDLIVARDLVARKTPPTEIAKRVARGNARMAERLVEAARRYRGEELEAMLIGLFEADLAIKTNVMEEEPALVAWLGEYLLAPRERARRREPGRPGRSARTRSDSIANVQRAPSRPRMPISCWSTYSWRHGTHSAPGMAKKSRSSASGSRKTVSNTLVSRAPLQKRQVSIGRERRAAVGHGRSMRSGGHVPSMGPMGHAVRTSGVLPAGRAQTTRTTWAALPHRRSRP